jgi:nucleotide-binding universal stress UspA family protein
MYQRILVPTDGSACGDKATLHALALANAVGSSVVFLYVMDTLRNYHEGVMADVLKTLSEQGEQSLARALRMASAAGVEAKGELAEGDPVDVIRARAEEFDLVVMCSHGKGLWKRLTVGSVTQAVLHRIARPLLVVPAEGAAASP